MGIMEKNMRVYYYINEEYGLQNIKQKRLKIATLMELNDPFEFLPIKLDNKDLRNKLHLMKKKLAKRIGFLCFSEDQYSPAQWAYYGDNHKGLCLGFDIPISNLKKIKYIQNRPNISVDKIEDMKYLEKLLEKKSKHWSYEKEWRYITVLEDKEKDGYYFEDFSQGLQLKEVYIGAKSTIKKEDIRVYLNGYNNEVNMFYTRPAHTKFSIVRDIKKNKIDS